MVLLPFFNYRFRKMKCFSRYLSYIFRPATSILSCSCHTEGTGCPGRRGGGAAAETGFWPPAAGAAVTGAADRRRKAQTAAESLKGARRLSRK